MQSDYVWLKNEPIILKSKPSPRSNSKKSNYSESENEATEEDLEGEEIYYPDKEEEDWVSFLKS